MIGFNFLLGMIMFDINLVDLFDLRYNNERMILFLPSIRLSWVGKGESLIVTFTISWLNLEFNIIGFNFDFYYDKLEHLIEDDSDDE